MFSMLSTKQICRLVCAVFVLSIIRLVNSVQVAIAVAGIVIVGGVLYLLHKKGKLKIGSDTTMENIDTYVSKIGIKFVILASLIFCYIFSCGILTVVMPFGPPLLAVGAVIVIVLIGIYCYIIRWQLWGIAFRKHLFPEDKISFFNPGDYNEKFAVYDALNNTSYKLCLDDKVFVSEVFVWLRPDDVSADMKRKTVEFEKRIGECGFIGDVAAVAVNGAVFARVVAIIPLRNLIWKKQVPFIDSCRWLHAGDYLGCYYVEIRRDEGVFWVEFSNSVMVRAVFQSSGAGERQYYIDYPYYEEDNALFDSVSGDWPDWKEDTFSLIPENRFFAEWNTRAGFKNGDEAFVLFCQSAEWNFGAVYSGDSVEIAQTEHDIKLAAEWLKAHKAINAIETLLVSEPAVSFWAARYFASLFPKTAAGIFARLKTLNDPVIDSLLK